MIGGGGVVVVDKEEKTARPGPDIMNVPRQGLQSVWGTLQGGATAAVVVGCDEVLVKAGCHYFVHPATGLHQA